LQGEIPEQAESPPTIPRTNIWAWGLHGQSSLGQPQKQMTHG
jgi:hypothetical protein